MENLTRTERVSELEEQLKVGDNLLNKRKNEIWVKVSRTSKCNLSEELAKDFTYCAIQEKIDRIKVQMQELRAVIISSGNIETL